MTIDPQVLKETDEFIDLQEAIFNVSNKNTDATLDICKKFFSQDGIDKQSLIDSFFHAVFSAIHCRPYNHDNVANICSHVFSTFQDTKLKNYFKYKILSMQIDRFENYEAIPFLQKCYYHKLFNEDEAMSIILRYKYLTAHNFNTVLSFFCYFAPIIQDEFPQLYNDCINRLNSKNEKSELPTEFQKFQKKFRFFKQMNWELQHVCSYNCYIPGTIEWAISNDDQKEMENIIQRIEYDAYKYIVNPDDYVLEYEQFHPNKRVPPSVFEPSRLLLNHPTLIQFAAYHGAINCFQYLLQLGASPKCIDQVGIGLSQFATAGGNLEIIQLCAQLNVNFARSCHFAVAYNNFDAMQWMIKYMGVRILNRDDVFGTLLHRAAASNNIRILKFCIDYCTDNAKKGVRNSCFDLHQQYLQSKRGKKEIESEEIKADNSEKEDSDSDSSSNSISDSDPEFIIINVVTIRGETPLHAAAAKGNLEAVKLLLGHKLVMPNAIGEDGCTPFYFAVLYNHLDVVDLMIKNNRININKPDDEGQTPLHMAIKHDYLEIVTKLLQSPQVQMNARNINGQTPLHFAAIYNQLEELKILLDDDRVNKNPQDNLGQTPLFVAVMQNNTEIIEELLSRKDISITISDELGFSPLHIAVELHQLECERLLLHMEYDQDSLINNSDMNANQQISSDLLKNQQKIRKEINCVDKRGMNAIQLATQNGDVESFLLLQDFINIFHKDNDGNSIVHIAAQNGQTELLAYFHELHIFDFMLKNKEGRTPFQSSILSPNLDTFLFFLRNKAELNCDESIHAVDNNGMSALSIAVKSQKVEIVQYLLQTVGGYNINEQNSSKQTPLHIASTLSNHEIISRLLKEDEIDINIADSHQNTPLHICIENKDEEDALLLLEKKECITNVQNDKGWTPLHYAASIGSVKLLIKIMSKKDTPIDVLNKEDDTPLDVAIQYRHKEAEEYLILKSSQKTLEIKDKSGNTAYDYAIATNQKDVAELINKKINSPISSFFQSIPKMTTIMIKH